MTTAFLDPFTHVYHTDNEAPRQTAIFLILEIPAVIFVTMSNILVLLLLKKMTKVQNSYFVVSLSVANLTAGLLGLPLAMFAHWSAFGGNSFCKIYHYFVQVSECAEIYSLVAIAIDRHRVVVGHRANHKVTNKVTSLTAVFGIWLFSMLFGLTAVFTHEETYRVVKDGNVIHHYSDCYTLVNSVLVRSVLYSEFILLFIIPLVLMSFFYTSIVHFIQREQCHSMSASSNRKNKVIKTILLLMGIFVIFNFPLKMFEFYVHYAAVGIEKENLIRETLEYVSFLHYGVNAFTYALCNTNFRMASNKLRGCCCVNVRVHPALYSEQGRGPQNSFFPHSIEVGANEHI